VILVRDGAEGRPEVFMVRRHPRSRFAADAFVFPGGTLREDDTVRGGLPPCSGLTAENAHRRLTERGSNPPSDAAESLQHYTAAVRELFEEAGILLARRIGHAAGPLDDATCQQLARLRPEVQQGRSLTQAALNLELGLMPEQLVYFSHWITPEPSPRRYDTRFFVVKDCPEQTASHCGIETVDGIWIAPAELLRRSRAGALTLVSVTAEHLRVLAVYPTVAALLAFARAKPIRTVLSVRSSAGWDLGGDGAPW